MSLGLGWAAFWFSERATGPLPFRLPPYSRTVWLARHGQNMGGGRFGYFRFGSFFPPLPTTYYASPWLVLVLPVRCPHLFAVCCDLLFAGSFCRALRTVRAFLPCGSHIPATYAVRAFLRSHLPLLARVGSFPTHHHHSARTTLPITLHARCLTAAPCTATASFPSVRFSTTTPTSCMCGSYHTMVGIWVLFGRTLCAHAAAALHGVCGARCVCVPPPPLPPSVYSFW